MKPFLSRKSTRKPGYNYSDKGYYFITIVVQDREFHLREVSNNTVKLSESGQIAEQRWLSVTSHNKILTSAGFVIMANHVHGIVQLHEPDYHFDSINQVSLGEVIPKFKAKSSLLIRANGLDRFRWQRNYYDHIIRSDKSLRLIQLYIATNPMFWMIDKENPNASIDQKLNASLLESCGFNPEDVDLLQNYVEYRIARESRAR